LKISGLYHQSFGYILSGLLFAVSCSSFAKEKMTEKTPYSIYRPYLKELIEAYAQEMQDQYGLRISGEGGGMHETIEEIVVKFIALRRASVEEARELTVRIAERLLRMINEDEKLRPYLCEYPFDVSRINPRISFEQQNRAYNDGTVTYVSLIKNNLFYDASEILTDNLQEILKEPYPKALKIVEEHPLQQDLRYHKAKPYEAEIDQLQYKFAEDMYKKWGFKCADIGGKMVDGIEQVAFNFVLFKRAALEEARIWEIKLTEELLRRINSNPKLRPYLKNYPFQAKNTQIKIEFWDKEKEYYRDGSIARLYQKDNRIYYLKCAPDLVTPEYTMFETPEPYMDEPYEEALKRQKLN
jgi:hypothetical protein